MKKTIVDGKHVYAQVTKNSINALKNALEPLAVYQEETGGRAVQKIREYKDTLAGSLLGMDYINKDNYGPDGYFSKSGLYYENKNTSITTKGGFKVEFKDTSKEKLDILKKGVTTTVAVWKNVSHIAYMLVGNTKFIGDLLEESYDKKNRKTCTVSAKDALARGFKMVAVEYSPSEAYANAYVNQKRAFQDFDIDSIYTAKDLKTISAEMM